ncbi:efflux transporter outer membrane subunit [Alsobacter sp. R-9]
MERAASGSSRTGAGRAGVAWALNEKARTARVTALRAAPLVSVLLLAGCAVGPDFTTPAAKVAPTWLEWREASLKSAPNATAAWWRGFHDPTLDRLVATAQAENLTLLSAGTRVLQARAELGIAVGEVFPQQQSADGSIGFSRSSQADPTAASGLKNYWRDSLGVRVAWELDFWGKFRRGVESADAAYLASIATYDDVLVTMLADVASTYIGIRTLERQIIIARANVVKSREVLRIARDRFKEGASSELDVLQAETILATTEASIPELGIQLRRGQNALRVLLGMEPKPLEALMASGTGRIPAAPSQVRIGIPADLLRRRPDIRAAELRVAAQSAQVGVAVAELYPAISISGSFGGVASNVNGANLNQVVKNAGMTYALGPSFQWNLLNYGQITNKVRLQDAALQQAIVDYQNTVLKAQADVENGIAAFTLSRVQAEALRRSATSAAKALDIAILEYQGGTRDFTTVLQAQQSLYGTQNNLAVASGGVSTGVVAIYRAVGGGWQAREGKGFVPPAVAEEMRKRTDWGGLLDTNGRVPDAAPGLPGPQDRGPTVRPPDF